MAMLQTQDANVLDAEAINWRLIVYPVLAVVVLLVGGLSLYYYQLTQRDQNELEARQAFVLAKTPEQFQQVADKYPQTSQADFALIAAADLSLNKNDFAAATKDYKRVVDASGTDAVLRDSAQVGLASTLESANKIDEAIKAYLTVAQRGSKSPYAPYAYVSAARLYEQKNDLENERKVLTEAAGLGGDSSFVKEADYRLKALKMQATKSPVPAAASATTPPAPNPEP